MARCNNPAFPNQRHFDGYVEMSKEDAALFWEIDYHLRPGPGDSSVGSGVTDRTVPVTEETVPENTAVTRPVPNEKPEDPQITGVCNRSVSDRQDTKPADSARLAQVQERAGAPVDDPVTSGSPCLQAITGTQTDETSSPQIETLKENEAPEALKETITPGPEQPVSNKTLPEGQRRADIETPMGRSLSSINHGLCCLSRKPPGRRHTE